jgi:hypothetical protein
MRLGVAGSCILTRLAKDPGPEPAQPPELEQPAERLGKFRIARHRGHLILPQIDEAVGERVEIVRLRHGNSSIPG